MAHEQISGANAEREPVCVAAAIIERDGRFLIARRRLGKHLEGKWEFPGGKLEAGESYEECLRRELAEEFEIDAEVRGPVGEVMHDYGTVTVNMRGYRVDYRSGEMRLHDHDKIAWVLPKEFAAYDLAEADIPLAEALIKENKG